MDTLIMDKFDKRNISSTILFYDTIIISILV